MAVCPGCGQDHQAAWDPPPDIDRDLTAIVAAILNGGSEQDFANILGTLDRAPSMAFRASQIVAYLCVEIAALGGAPNPQELALAHIQKTLLHYATEQDPKEDT